MLTALQLQQQRRRRAVPSLKQQYHEYILQRIESCKNTLSRRELLELGDQAVAELEAAGDQFLLTQVLLTEGVDRLIHKRLRLQPYSRWSRQLKQLRDAQREPTHWGIDRRSPVTRLLPRLEPSDNTLVIGADAAPFAYLLAAHSLHVVFTGCDMTFVDQVESRVAEEALGLHCITYVAPTTQVAETCPETVHVVVIDTGTLESESAAARREILESLCERTAPGGVHLILPSPHALAPDAFLSHYSEWIREPAQPDKRRPARSHGLMLAKPPEADELRTPLASRELPA